MSVRLIALDPGTGGNDCPAVFIDEDTGDLVVQGYEETDAAKREQMNSVSRMRPGETAVRLPARMRDLVLRALELEKETDGADDRPGADAR